MSITIASAGDSLNRGVKNAVMGMTFPWLSGDWSATHESCTDGKTWESLTTAVFSS